MKDCFSEKSEQAVVPPRKDDHFRIIGSAKIL